MLNEGLDWSLFRIPNKIGHWKPWETAGNEGRDLLFSDWNKTRRRDGAQKPSTVKLETDLGFVLNWFIFSSKAELFSDLVPNSGANHYHHRKFDRRLNFLIMFWQMRNWIFKNILRITRYLNWISQELLDILTEYQISWKLLDILTEYPKNF